MEQSDEKIFDTTSIDTRNLIDGYKHWSVEDIKTDLKRHAFNYHIAIENFQHDFNIGTIVRNANAFHASGVHIIGKRHWNRRGAMMTEQYLEVYYHQTVLEFIEWTKAHHYKIYGIDNIAGSVPLSKITLPKKGIFVFGQEGPGLSIEMQKMCTAIIAIEQFGSTRSINVGVASGILMYEWIKTQHLLEHTN